MLTRHLAWLLLSSSLALTEQSVRLSGTVSDPSSAQIPNAKVRLLSLDRVLESTTDQGGHFLFASVAPGVYDLELSSPGFSKQGLHLDLTKVHDRSLDVTLGVKTNDCGPVPSISYLPAKSGEPRLTGTISEVEKPQKRISRGKAYVSTGGDKTLSSHVDHTGSFQFDQLPPAEYNLRLTAPGYFDETIKVLVPRENDVRVEVSLPKRGPLIICQ